MGWWTLSFALVVGCAAHLPEAAQLSGPTIEQRLDDAKPDERLPLPDRANEIIMRFDPAPASYVPLTVKLLLAGPGRVVVTLYQTSPEGNIGAQVQRIERDLNDIYVSDGKDGRWVLERLSIPTLHGPLWIGLSGGGTVWASSRDSSWVFQRSASPNLYSGKLPRTPLVRVEVAPAQPRK